MNKKAAGYDIFHLVAIVLTFVAFHYSSVNIESKGGNYKFECAHAGHSTPF